MVSAGIGADRQADRQTDTATQLCVYLIGFISNKMNKPHT